MQSHTRPFKLHQTSLKKGRGWYEDKKGGRGKFGGAGRKEDGNCRRTLKIQKSNCLQENLDPFIASIYM